MDVLIRHVECQKQDNSMQPHLLSLRVISELIYYFFVSINGLKNCISVSIFLFVFLRGVLVFFKSFLVNRKIKAVAFSLNSPLAAFVTRKHFQPSPLLAINLLFSNYKFSAVTVSRELYLKEEVKYSY